MVTVDCVSKRFCMPGYRIGFAAGPQKMTRAMSAYLGQTLGPPCSLTQQAAAAALEAGPGFTRAMCRAYEKRRDYCLSRLEAMDGLRCEKPQGAFYLFPNIEQALKDGGWEGDIPFCMELLRSKGLAISPGTAFRLPGHLRIAYVRPEEELKEAMDLLEAFLLGR